MTATWTRVEDEIAGALLETQGDIPIANVRARSVEVSFDVVEGSAVITFGAVTTMPRVQYDAVLREVAAEREAREPRS
ncbi:hypothetical protein [Microbacterium sp. NPDC080220]|uniref:hypothetical protein n=1 Tax=Microbacterium sp. NPDC080220 TaxID=3161017 RepID=UPI003448C5C1